MSPAAGVDVGALDVLERIAVLGCERRGPLVDLLLDRGAHRRAQFVFTRARPADDLLANSESGRERATRPVRPASAGPRPRPNRDRQA